MAHSDFKRSTRQIHSAARARFPLAMLTYASQKDGIEPFRFHDLKRKGTTDAKGDKLAASGHKSAAMLTVYDVSLPEVGPTK
jgi:hypothetical protein